MKWVDITERHHDTVVTLDVQGQVAAGAPDPALRERIVDLVDKGYRRFIIDLQRTPQMDSMALGEIVRAYIRALREGAAVKFVGATSRVRLLLDVTRLSTAFELYDSEADALRSYEQTNVSS